MDNQSILAIDMMGGDFAPQAAVDGVKEALERFGDAYKLLLVGQQGPLEPLLREAGLDLKDARLELVDAPEVVGMGEHPVQAIRNKRKSSISIGMDLVKAGRAQGFFSAGNTGAVVAAAFLKWRMLPGLSRPGLATAMPGENGFWLLMDAGATVDCSAQNLAQFAVMGDLYARRVMGCAAPKVGLLSNGTEVSKGNRQTQDAFKLLNELKNINFVGNIEGHDLFTQNVDVVICDGFVGNVVLKTSERLAKFVGQLLKQQLLSKTAWKLGALMCKGAFEALKKSVDATEVGGVPLLGVNGNCVIGHGNSNGHAIANGIRAVGRLVECRLNDDIINQVHESALDNME